MLTAKIDVTKIDKARLFKGKPGKDGVCPMYLDIAIMESKPTNYGDWRDEQTHFIVQSVSKQERLNGIKGNIIGNACDKDRNRKPAPEVPGSVETTPAIDAMDNDDVPF